MKPVLSVSGTQSVPTAHLHDRREVLAFWEIHTHNKPRSDQVDGLIRYKSIMKLLKFSP